MRVASRPSIKICTYLPITYYLLPITYILPAPIYCNRNCNCIYAYFVDRLRISVLLVLQSLLRLAILQINQCRQRPQHTYSNNYDDHSSLPFQPQPQLQLQLQLQLPIRCFTTLTYRSIFVHVLEILPIFLVTHSRQTRRTTATQYLPIAIFAFIPPIHPPTYAYPIKFRTSLPTACIAVTLNPSYLSVCLYTSISISTTTST